MTKEVVGLASFACVYSSMSAIMSSVKNVGKRNIKVDGWMIEKLIR